MSDDITQVARDDALIEALIRDEAPPADDALAGMLAAWRSDLLSEPSSTSADPPIAPPADLDRARRRRRRALIMVVTAVVGIGAGTSAAAASAGPDSPLWPITQALYPERAASRVAEEAAEASIEKAREAIDQQRYADAEQLLNQATAQTGEVTDPGVVQRLLGEIAAVKGLLPGLVGGDRTGGNPSGGTSNPTTGPAPAATGGPAPTATGGVLPPLPLPSLPLPPLPTLLPSLPVPLPSLPLFLDD